MRGLLIGAAAGMLLTMITARGASAETRIDVIPTPQEVVAGEGVVTLLSDVKRVSVVTGEDAHAKESLARELILEEIETLTGVDCASVAPDEASARIILSGSLSEET